MKGVYDAYKACKTEKTWRVRTHKDDSFSDDKWGSGDIWASTYSVTSTPLHGYTEYAWGELNKVLELGGVQNDKSNWTKTLIPQEGYISNASLCSVQRTKGTEGTYQWQSWSWGRQVKVL